MNQLTTLMFPDTQLCTKSVWRELFFFNTINYYHSTESEDDDRPACDALEEPGLCRGYAPAPLGEDLERFKMLLRELKGNEGEFYSGQLSSMTLEYLENRDTENTLKLISAMMEEPAKTAKKQDREQNEVLWKARLYLKLAEIIQREEEEMETSISSLADLEKKIFKQLKGDEDEEIPAIQPSSNSRMPIRTHDLLKAWGHLFMADHKPCQMLLTASHDSADILLDIAESNGKCPTLITTLPLPSLPANMETFPQIRESFRTSNTDILNSFASLFNDLSKNGLSESISRELNEATENWRKTLQENSLLPHQPEPPSLAIYSCELSLSMLMSQFCGTAQKSPAATELQHGLIAIRKKQSFPNYSAAPHL